MPREREEFFRESNTSEREKIFVLAFEGNETEDKYFSEFRDSHKFNDERIYLHLLKRAKNDTNSAPNHVFNFQLPLIRKILLHGSHRLSVALFG